VVIGEQVELDGQLLETPGAQVTNGPGVDMHWPPQLLAPPQIVVGVHVEPVGQPEALPISVQGITGGGVNIDRQSPPQVIVCVQIEPVGHKLTPPTIHGVGVLVTFGLVIVLW